MTATDPMPVLRLLLEVFCRILDRPASYERAGRTLLMDQHLVQVVVARVSTTTLSPQLLQTAATYFENEGLNATELESITPALRFLFDWIGVVCRVRLLSSKLDTQKKAVEDRQRQRSEYVKEMTLEQTFLEQAEVTLDDERMALEAWQAAREKMEQEFNQLHLCGLHDKFRFGGCPIASADHQGVRKSHRLILATRNGRSDHDLAQI
jgi:uncharacterized protein YacL (UPF0231 family)